jgi:spondin-1
VTFEGLWSRHTHPKDFPTNGWLTRFSDVIGASHTVDYRFWEYGGISSEGVRQVSEKGSTRMLESELKSEVRDLCPTCKFTIVPNKKYFFRVSTSGQ